VPGNKINQHLQLLTETADRRTDRHYCYRPLFARQINGRRVKSRLGRSRPDMLSLCRFGSGAIL
jgi:hypothetical protein